ncbi:DNA topoisomerase 2-associated protein PAT1, partial [Lecanoromycetidae sp. Uapishka_2]
MSYAYFRHPTQAPGFGSAPDPFASISQNREPGQDDEEGIDFDDTYDGLGDRLDEADDDFNEDTFGGGGVTTNNIGKDFDFHGSTAKVSNAINEEAVDASLWGTGPASSSNTHGAQQTQQSTPSRSTGGPPAKKMMSLEEVEAAMREQPKKPSSNQLPPQQTQVQPPLGMPQLQQHVPPFSRPQQYPAPASHLPPTYLQQGQAPQSMPPPDLGGGPIKIQQRPQQQPHISSQITQAELPARASPAQSAGAAPQATAPPQALQRGQDPVYQAPDARASPQPRQILQNPNRRSGQFNSRPAEPHSVVPTQQAGPLPSHNSHHSGLPIIYHPSQIMDLPEEERKHYLKMEEMRAKRNHKIFLLSKGNGLMTPQDKNFITRIQLQQLMTSTGNVNEQDPDASLSEDFYYQVYNQIENRPRQNPQQPLRNFAQTYLFRTGGRQGGMSRRQRGGDSHMQRMENQVQRAVEAAKARPKNKQLVIEGSLGKISFSNAKTPKPLLNINRHDSESGHRPTSKKAPQVALSTTDRKAILKNIEAVYTDLMRMEDHDRRRPPPLNDDDDPVAIQHAVDWQQMNNELSQKLWSDLKVTEPVMPDTATLHPFIAFLSYPKGKKAVPRIFNHIDETQRLTILTMIILHLDILDVIRLAQPQMSGVQPSSNTREQVDLFLQTVMPSLFLYVTEAPLGMVIGMLGLVTERVNIKAVARTRVGLELLTMILSRAAIIKVTENTDDDTWDQWLAVYNRFFDTIEPSLGEIFPNAVNAGQDQYVWQFLAATGSGASPEQQQRLVISVKDRVMETLQQGKTLPPDMALQRRGNVNLFMQAIGLDVDLLDG